jgi:raffinose/stachyose/melibiose transport system permease protein
MKIKINKFILQIFLFLWGVVNLFPIYWLSTFSLKNNSEIFGENIIGLPKYWIFANYKQALFGGKVGLYLINSILITVCTVILTVILAVMASYALTRMKWRGRKFVTILFTTGMMIPIHAALLPLFISMSRVHILDTYLALIIPYTGFGLPMAIMIITGFIDAIPRAMEESACIDGASIYKTVWAIITPMLIPAIVTVSIFTFIQYWNELLFAQVFISSESLKTLTAGIQGMYGQYQTDWGSIGAALMIATLPTLIIYCCMSSQVQKSFLVGAVKG